MGISNVPMPSFTLVLTTGHRSHRRHPSTITFDTSSSALDRLMKTIDLRDELEHDDYGHYTNVSTTSIGQKDIVIPEEVELSSPGSVGKEDSHSIKVCNILVAFPSESRVERKVGFRQEKLLFPVIATKAYPDSKSGLSAETRVLHMQSYIL